MAADLKKITLSEQAKTEFQQRVHDHLERESTIPDLAAFEPQFESNSQEYLSALQSLVSKYFIELTSTTKKSFVLTQDAIDRLNGKPAQEQAAFDWFTEKKTRKETTEHFKGPMMGVINGLVKDGFLTLVKEGPEPSYVQGKSFVDSIFPLIQAFAALPNREFIGDKLADQFQPLQKKKLLNKLTTKVLSISRGREFANFTLKKQVNLTNNMLADRSWANQDLKEKKFTVSNDVVPFGKLHPLVETRSQFRRIFLKLGFTEMFTRRYVESSFWNFDALFQPQAHPCRDQQDTFFVAAADRDCPTRPSPSATDSASQQSSTSSASTEHPHTTSLAVSSASGATPLSDHDLARLLYPEPLRAIRSAHEDGGELAGGSTGLRYRWNVDEARKNVLRTHTTAISARTLATLTEGLRRYWDQGEFTELRTDASSTPAAAASSSSAEESKNLASRPLCKFFSIDRVFRNETLDKTHLAEFHQLEGFAIGENLNVGDLMGTIKAFFAEIGMTDVKFQPTYNPYTEPSLEMYAYNKILKKWIEIGNSGIFRDEVMIPLGMKPNVRAIAWGLSLERPAMIQADIGDIESLFGKKVDVEWVEKSSSKMLHQ